MHEMRFIQDMATIMLVAGVITIFFHRLKQPVVLGYILAGIVIGPHTPPIIWVSDKNTIQTFADLGVIFLMFSLGLEFSLAHLKKVGLSSLVAAVLEIVLMIAIGYEIGRFFGWKDIDSLFLGAMLAISSTTIIVKTLNELGMQKERFAQFVFGILIIEDILGIVILALLSGFGTSDSLKVMDVVTTSGQLFLFLIISLVSGILIVPRILKYVHKWHNDEMLLITVLALCFGFCLLVIKLHYSIVLGAFVMGAIIAESRQLKTIEILIKPLRDMFSAVFFVAIGLMFDPSVLFNYTVPIIVITLAVVVGKVISCSFGTFLTGQKINTSLRVGMSMAQIGEFSFIIAALGTSLHVTGDFLYPLAVTVSAITTVLTPYLIKFSDPLAMGIKSILPRGFQDMLRVYPAWIYSLQSKTNKSELSRIFQSSLVNIFLSLSVIITIFLVVAHFEDDLLKYFSGVMSESVVDTFLWGTALLLSLPFLIAIYRKIKALSMMLAAMSVRPTSATKFTKGMRKIIAEVIPVLSIVGILLFISAVSTSILPPLGLLILVLCLAIAVIAFLWGFFIKLHSRLQISVIEAFDKDKDKDQGEHPKQ